MIENNIYKPVLMTIHSEYRETSETKTLGLKFQLEDDRIHFFKKYHAGQFGQFSVYGEGECPFCISSPPDMTDRIECTFRRVGRVTSALMELNIGATIGFRGPYGNGFPIEKWKGKNLLFIAGGIALPALRSVILACLGERNNFKKITIIYGVRSPEDLIYKSQLSEWNTLEDVNVIKTVDPGGENPEWDGKIGLVPHVLYNMNPNPENTIAVVCGPPVMIKYTFMELHSGKFDPDLVYTTIENRMKCGIGKCGRCNIGHMYVCKSGPVFTMSQLQKLPKEY